MRFCITEAPATSSTLQRTIEGTLQYIGIGRRQKAPREGWLAVPDSVVDHKADGTSIKITCEYHPMAMDGTALEVVGYCAGEWLRSAVSATILLAP